MFPVHYTCNVYAGGAFASGLKEKEYQEPWVCKNVKFMGPNDYAWLLVLLPSLFLVAVCVVIYCFCWMLLQDYYSYYPVTLPVRRPYSGNPGMFGGTS